MGRKGKGKKRKAEPEEEVEENSSEELAEDEDGAVDIGYALAAVTRTSLEHLVMTLVQAHPDMVDTVMDVLRKPLSMEVISAEMESSEDGPTAAVEEWTERADMYTKAKDLYNSTNILQVVSAFLVEYSLPMENNEDDRQEIAEVFSRVESAWEAAFSANEKEVELDVGRTKELLKQLERHRDRLQKTKYGPIFSDPIRSIKKQVK